MFTEEQCVMGEACPNWALWLEEIGFITTYLDQRIADLTEQAAKHYYTNHREHTLVLARLDAFEEIRDLL